MNPENQIYFYEHEFYVFSNFSSFMLEWKGVLYMTSEHAYHSERFTDQAIKEGIKNCRSAYDAHTYAQKHKHLQVENWNDIKLSVMKEILHKKVEQHPFVKEKLLESGDRELVKDSPPDSFWGWGENKDGENYLGKLWMEVREELKAKQ